MATTRSAGVGLPDNASNGLARMMTDVPDAAPAAQPVADSRVFESLLASVIDAAYGMALRLTKNRADAEDLVQETALLAFRGFGTFMPGTNFKAWFFRILTNCYYTGRRRQQHRPSTIDFDDTPDLYLYKRSREYGLPQSTSDPAASLLERLDTERVSAAIEELPEEYRVVSVLYFMEDLSYQQIADILGCPVGTVRSRLHRGRKMLQKALWKLAEECGIVRDLSGDRDEETS
jgi:RNA polymerase sigma-70 factor, ECF subfamily